MILECGHQPLIEENIEKDLLQVHETFQTQDWAPLHPSNYPLVFISLQDA